MFCGKCGFKFPDDYLYCPKCGFKMDETLINSIKEEANQQQVEICNEIENKPIPKSNKIFSVFAGLGYGFATGSIWTVSLLMIFVIFRSLAFVNFPYLIDIVKNDPLSLFDYVASIDVNQIIYQTFYSASYLLIPFVVISLFTLLFSSLGKKSYKHRKMAKKGKSKSIRTIICASISVLFPLFYKTFFVFVFMIFKLVIENIY